MNKTAIRVKKEGSPWAGVVYTIYVRTEGGHFTSVATVTIHETDTNINWSGMGDQTTAFAEEFHQAIGVGLQLMEIDSRQETEIKYAFNGDEMIG
jgi:hypothetical protein